MRISVFLLLISLCFSLACNFDDDQDEFEDSLSNPDINTVCPFVTDNNEVRGRMDGEYQLSFTMDFSPMGFSYFVPVQTSTTNRTSQKSLSRQASAYSSLVYFTMTGLFATGTLEKDGVVIEEHYITGDKILLIESRLEGYAVEDIANFGIYADFEGVINSAALVDFSEIEFLGVPIPRSVNNTSGEVESYQTEIRVKLLRTCQALATPQLNDQGLLLAASGQTEFYLPFYGLSLPGTFTLQYQDAEAK